MPKYLVAIHHRDDYDPVKEEDQAMMGAIKALNKEMIAAGIRVFVGGLHLASGKAMRGLVVPHLVGDDVDVPRAGDRQPPTDILVANLGGEQKLEGPSEFGRRGLVAVGQTDRERIEQHVGQPGRNRPWWGSPRGGRISTARCGLQPTCTAPSGRSSTGSAGSSAYSDGVGCAILALCHGAQRRRISYPQR